MAVIKELYGVRKDGVRLYRTYSNQNKKIKQLQTGIIYEDAVDVETANYSYIETDETIEETPTE